MAEKGREGGSSPMEDPEEQGLLVSVLDSFRSYRRLAHFNGTHVRRQAFYSLPQEHWALLSKPPFSLLDTFSKMDDLIDSNAELAEAIFVAGFKAFLAPTLDNEWVASRVSQQNVNDEFLTYSLIMGHLDAKTSQNDTEKARSCVNQFYREWSAEGAVERSKCFDPVIAALEHEFASRAKDAVSLDRSDLKVLVPGVGLGRLVFDICRAGFSVEGNEISYHMLAASALVLNNTQRVKQYKIAPFALNSSNHISRADQFQTFEVPDVHPAAELVHTGTSGVPGSERMTMSMGDFCVVYSRPDYAEVFDAVATVFFIDTAPNIIRYIEAVRNCLKPGGIWTNLGPLLWHHMSRNEHDEDESEEEKRRRIEVVDAGIGDPGSVELTNEEVVALVEHMGFTIEKQEVGTIETGYISNPRSMLQSTYRPSFWTARKK
ncbi:methyltransferas-like protein [Clathrospora elynae]|uniref:carnosine N-methyltransferase n=1 Tax=Clathrospora elynae TaxID=706981 RepID=A0A6A5T4K9_9PLEO|nr:methyltransferas-like protein [Clathrospora elynae]